MTNGDETNPTRTLRKMIDESRKKPELITLESESYLLDRSFKSTQFHSTNLVQDDTNSKTIAKYE